MHLRAHDEIDLTVYETNDEVGAAVADAFSAAARKALETKESIAVILATGNSQLSFIRAVTERPDIDWSRITVLHLDEYLGMAEEHPASFRRWMKVNLASRVPLKSFEGVRGDHNPVADELRRYDSLLRSLDPDICVMGIGENGHLAFNDPPADFEATDLIRVVDMDEASRRQQVGEGHFPTLDDAPSQALSLTIPALLAPQTLLVGVPEARKAEAVKRALEGPLDPQCPASILRTHPNARVFLDRESSSLLSSR